MVKMAAKLSKRSFLSVFWVFFFRMVVLDGMKDWFILLRFKSFLWFKMAAKIVKMAINLSKRYQILSGSEGKYMLFQAYNIALWLGRFYTFKMPKNHNGSFQNGCQIVHKGHKDIIDPKTPHLAQINVLWYFSLYLNAVYKSQPWLKQKAFEKLFYTEKCQQSVS